MRIYLTGFMGSGKTAVGEALAARLDCAFLDLDCEVERDAGRTVRDVFAAGGEAEFRAREQAALRRTLDLDDLVVATGGGTVTVEANRELMARHGVSVWLNPPFATIVERIGFRGKSDRPLFGDETQALALYRARLPLYRRCDLQVDVGPREEPAEVAARIQLMMARRACGS